jgi:cold shock CspA family protein/ribosome-associated translation inhibitor RaiA
MRTPLQLSGPDFHLTAAIKDDISQRAAKLDRLYGNIIGARVSVEAPVHHHRKGGPFNVRIDLVVPGRELAASHRSGESLAIAVREAFEAMHRQLVEYSRLQAREVKSHDGPPRGVVVRVMPQGYGFIAADDGREIYFHRNSLVDCDFDRLRPGTRVWFSEETGDNGPQASTVHVTESGGSRPA